MLNEITVSQSALLNNYEYFARTNPHLQIAPVLKANAYGHGLELIGNFIQQKLPDIPFVCVDSLYEAYQLSKSNIKLNILIMGYTNPINYQVAKKLPYIFGISDLPSLEILGKYQPGARIHIELDTGLNRLGFTHNDIPQLTQTLKKFSRLKIEGVYSHFASADDPTQLASTKRQVNNFKLMVNLLEKHGFYPKYRHIAATAGAELAPDSHFNLIRPGLGFYGYSPFGPRTTEGIRQRANLIPALTLTTHIGHLKTIQAGDRVGYSSTYIAKQTERIATLPLGYYEFFDRQLSNSGTVTINGNACPIVGKISMNMTTIKIPRNLNLDLNSPVTIINPDPLSPNSIYAFAKATQTIPYTVLTRLHNSIRRRII